MIPKKRFRSILTPAGYAVVIIALVILVRALIARNSYEIILAAAALLLCIALGIIGTWKSRTLVSLEPGWITPFPMTADSGEEALVTGLGIPIPWFFRLHFIVRGRFFPAGQVTAKDKGCSVFFETSVSRKEPQGKFYFDFPMSGVFTGKGFCRLRDIFGFFSFPCGSQENKTINIRCAPSIKSYFHIKAQSGAEDQRNKADNDEERYYMREYTPGDRFRDINWKSSDRIDTLITRISPQNQEKVNRIEIYFRNYNPSEKISLEDHWFLDRAKARLSRFLRSFKDEKETYIFNIRTAGGSYEIKNQDEVEDFLETLAGIPFAKPDNEIFSAADVSGEIYVFSTVCDIGLQGFLQSCRPGSFSLFLVKPAEKKSTEIEIFDIKDFIVKNCIPKFRWLFHRVDRQFFLPECKAEISYVMVSRKLIPKVQEAAL